MAKLKFYTDKDLIIQRMHKIITYLVLGLVLSAIVFTVCILIKEYKSVKVYLQQSVLQTASNVRGHIRNDIISIKNLSYDFTLKNISADENNIKNFLSQNVKKDNYYNLGFIYPDGKAVVFNRKKGILPSENYTENSCFSNALSGNPCYAGTNEENQSASGCTNTYYIPVFDNSNKVTGILYAQTDSDVIKKILSLNNYNNNGYTHIIDSDGNYIIKSQNELNNYVNFFDAKIKFIRKSKEEIQESLKTENSGTFLFEYNGKIYISAFAFIGNNNSFVLTDIPLEVLMLHINTLLGGLIVIFLAISVLLLALLKYSTFFYRQNESVIYKMAFTDEIIESGNKTKFLLDTQQIFEKSSDSDNYALISAEIANFKALGELFGYDTANKILKGIYSIIKRNLPKKSAFARDFASNFIILYKYEKEDFIVRTFIPKLTYEIEKYNEEVMLKLKQHNPSKKISKLNPVFGIYLIENINSDIVQMCDRAFLTKNNIKNSDIQNYQFYDDGLKEKYLQDKTIEMEMNEALKNKQFKMFLQPKFDLKTNKVAGAEALVRWYHPKRGIIPPMEFFPVFEKNGFVLQLDRYIWQQACNFLSIRKLAGEELFPVSVNVSKLHFNNDNFIDELLKLTSKYSVEPKYLELEFEEDSCLLEDEKITRVIKELKEAGFTISVDNFGKGSSSINILKNLPIDALKLDRIFLSSSNNDEKVKILIDNIINMANQLNIITVAEGVETPEQVKFLQETGCKTAQGFYFGRPVDETTFMQVYLKK